MIDRRGFLSTLSGSAMLAAVPVPVPIPIPAIDKGSPESVVPGSRLRVSLNGDWEHRIDGKLYDRIVVPSSRRPSGFYTLNRNLVLTQLRHGERAFIHFEAVTYWGRVSVNGEALGTMGPYVPYEFEFTRVAKEGANEFQVEIADLVAFADGTAEAEIGLGVHSGFEAYGGIIRDVWVEVRPASFIENVSVAYDLNDNYSICYVRPKVMVQSAEAKNARVETVLRYRDAKVAQASQTVQLKVGLNEIDLSCEIKGVAAWSPETPNLYDLTVHLGTDAPDAEDFWSCRTGFREIRAVAREFRLNGKKLVLKGVCRHDMWEQQGFTLSRQQQEQDMRMIKSLGCNFVRLVHYPHDRHIVELADELGLLVSEEPGFWQMDFETMERSRIELGYRILEAAIRRDWNSPSVMIWFLCNECNLTVDYLREGKQRCNHLDPIGRLVSAANDRDPDKVKDLFVAADLDFFDQHEYDFTLDEMDQEARFDGPSKPLMFSEWGGKQIGQDEPIMGQTVDRLIDLTESGALSGHAFWSWQDIRQYTRVDGEIRQGVLESGVVTEGRKPRAGVWTELSRLFAGHPNARREDTGAAARLTVLPLRRVPFDSKNTFRCVDMQALVDSADGRKSWSALEASLEKYWAESTAKDQWRRSESRFGLWQPPEIKIAGVLFSSPIVGGAIRPVVLTGAVQEMVIPFASGRGCVQLHILGQVTFPVGYPVIGQPGETVGTYTLQYASGNTQALPVRNGIEIAQSNCIDLATRIDPIATAAQPAVRYIKDIFREQYQILLWSIPIGRNEDLASLRCQLNAGQPAIAIFAITSEHDRA